MTVTDWVKNVGRLIVFVVALPLLLPIAVISRIFWPKANVSADEVLAWLKEMDAGKIDEWGWDDFLNVPIKNDDLDAIRSRCDDIWWQEESPYLEGKWGKEDFGLNAAGKDEIRKLIRQCEAIKREQDLEERLTKH